MPFVTRLKTLLDRDGLRPALVPLVSHLARSQHRGVKRVFYDQGIWMHETSNGFSSGTQPVHSLSHAACYSYSREAFRVAVESCSIADRSPCAQQGPS